MKDSPFNNRKYLRMYRARIVFLFVMELFFIWVLTMGLNNLPYFTILEEEDGR